MCGAKRRDRLRAAAGGCSIKGAGWAQLGRFAELLGTARCSGNWRTHPGLCAGLVNPTSNPTGSRAGAAHCCGAAEPPSHAAGGDFAPVVGAAGSLLEINPFCWDSEPAAAGGREVARPMAGTRGCPPVSCARTDAPSRLHVCALSTARLPTSTFARQPKAVGWPSATTHRNPLPAAASPTAW